MVDIDAIREKMTSTGRTIPRVAEIAGIQQKTFYNRLHGIGEFTATEIAGLTKALELTDQEREQIFFTS